MRSSPPALEIAGLVKRYPTGTEALKSVSLDIEAGEFFGLLGPNGAGKSTLIHCTTGLAQPTSGAIRVFGHDAIEHYQDARLAVGLAPQELNMDEPTAGVDVELRLELWHYVQRINAEGTTILLTTHYLEEAEQLCSRIAFINDGRIVAQGTSGELAQEFGVASLEDAYLELVGRKELSRAHIAGDAAA